MATRRYILPLLLFFSACSESGKDPYAGWDTFVGPEERFELRYLSPPWTTCSGTEFEPDCFECPDHLIGAARCGGASSWFALWVPPALLLPEYLLIPPFKLEISWFAAGDQAALSLAQAEEAALGAAGLEVVTPSSLHTLFDGTIGADVEYRGPVHLVVDDDPVDRPDEREYRVLYVVDGAWAYRVAMDTAIDISLPEVRDMLASFAVLGDGT